MVRRIKRIIMTIRIMIVVSLMIIMMMIVFVINVIVTSITIISSSNRVLSSDHYAGMICSSNQNLQTDVIILNLDILGLTLMLHDTSCRYSKGKKRVNDV